MPKVWPSATRGISLAPDAGLYVKARCALGTRGHLLVVPLLHGWEGGGLKTLAAAVAVRML